MKKIFKFFAMLIMILASISPFAINYSKEIVSAAADNEAIKTNIENTIIDFLEVNQETKERFNRFAGSVAEQKSAEYIHKELMKLQNFLPVNNLSTENGIQNFEFISQVDGSSCTSQNVIFRRNTAADSKKKVILCAHYDTEYVFTIENGNALGIDIEGLNDNGASVALLIELAKTLDSLEDLGFSIELAFFGAGKNECAGSQFYNRGITEEEAEDILLVVNFDKIALGDKLYMYVNEFKTPQQSYYTSLFKNLSIKNIELKNINETNVDSLCGLNYSHIALESDNAVFMKRHINVLSFFAGYYEKPIVYGHKEFAEGKSLTYTSDDNYLKAKETHPEFLDNAANVFLAVQNLLSDSNFISQMQKDNGSSGWYSFWTNEKLSAILTLVFLAFFWILYAIIFNKLQQKSRESINGKAVENIIIKITKNLGEDDDELTRALDKKIKYDTIEKNGGNTSKDDDKDAGNDKGAENKQENKDKDDKSGK